MLRGKIRDRKVPRISADIEYEAFIEITKQRLREWKTTIDNRKQVSWEINELSAMFRSNKWTKSSTELGFGEQKRTLSLIYCIEKKFLTPAKIIEAA